MAKILLPFICILSLVVCASEVDISVPGFPEMAHYFGVNDGAIQLTIAYNFIGFCLASLFYGPLSEAFGRRPIMIIGNTLLLIGSIACVISPNIPFLLCARFVQGIGASTSAVLVFAIIADVYQGKQSIKIISIMNAVLTIIITIAPIVGGFITEIVGWRGNYGIVAIIACLSWGSIILKLPETITSCRTVILKPVVKDYVKLFTDGKFLCVSIIPSILYACYLTFITAAPFLYQDTFKMTLRLYVAHQGIIVFSFAIISIFAPKITSKLGSHFVTILGLSLTFVGGLAMWLSVSISANTPNFITFTMTIFSIGFALCYPVIFSSSLEIFPEIKGTASSAIMSMRALICSALISISGYFYNDHIFSIGLLIFIGSCIGVILYAIWKKFLRH